MSKTLNTNTYKSLLRKGIASGVMALMMSATPGLAQTTRWTELNQWNFKRQAETQWQNVTIPHSTNAIDGRSAKYYRGLTTYRTTLPINYSAKEWKKLTDKHEKSTFLYFMGAAQAATVSINGKTAAVHKGGYTPFCVDISNMLSAGENTIEVSCNNALDREMAPVSSDFNKNNGLHNPVFLIQTGSLYCDMTKMGYDAMHVTPLEVSQQSARIKVNTIINNASAKPQKLKATITLRDAQGSVVAQEYRDIKMKGSSEQALEVDMMLHNPHLWQGIKDPYLYEVEMELHSGNNIIESHKTKTGIRYYSLDPEKGFMLNGKPYSLRGFSMHQDWEGSASAVTKEQTDKDFEIIRELGMNVIRLAHYPHNSYILQKCDELGLVVQTEIPWVNECGTDTTLYNQKAYTDNLHQQLREMITNHYNHPSIVFWGLWNELGNIDGSKPQGGKLDKQCVLHTTASLYKLAHALDSTRSVGFADASFGLNTPDLKLGEHYDYFAFNAYNGWYQNCKTPEGASKFANILDRLHKRSPIVAITEYGSGSNAFCHSEAPATTTKPSVGGARHDEEWANIVHERHLQAIETAPWLQFTTSWILFDFAVGARHEGYMLSNNQIDATVDSTYMFTNDKGIVTRNREVKKDAFYLYKAKWNPEPTLHITSSRFEVRPSDSITIKVYSNLAPLTLYQNGQKIETLTSSGEPTGVIYTFKRIPFINKRDTFCITATDSTGKLHKAEATFETSKK